MLNEHARPSAVDHGLEPHPRLSNHRPPGRFLRSATGFLRTDGSFVDAKEHLGGFILVEADELDAALEIAARVPARTDRRRDRGPAAAREGALLEHIPSIVCRPLGWLMDTALAQGTWRSVTERVGA